MTPASAHCLPVAPRPDPGPGVVFRPRRGWVSIDLSELWRYRELIGFLAMRDLRVRYKQSILGIAWAVIQPLMTMVVFALLFIREQRLAYLSLAVLGGHRLDRLVPDRDRLVCHHRRDVDRVPLF